MQHQLLNLISNKFVNLFQRNGSSFVYSNKALDSETQVPSVRYFDTISIPFSCHFASTGDVSENVNAVPNRLIMRKEGKGYLDAMR